MKTILVLMWSLKCAGVMAQVETDIRSIHLYEGKIVRLKNVTIEPQLISFYPWRAGIIRDSRDTTTYWIDGGSDIPGYMIPAGATTITGSVVKYRDTFQLQPESHKDIPAAVLIDPGEHAHLREYTLEVMNWNLEFFGATREVYKTEYGPADEERQLTNAAKLLARTKPDIVALQEISDDGMFRRLIGALDGYDGQCSERYSYSHDTTGGAKDFPPQKLCFLYRTDVVRDAQFRVMFEKLYDDAAQGKSNLLDHTPGGAAAAFSVGRLPFRMEADVMVAGGTRHIAIINIHAKSGAAEPDRRRRAFDSKILKDSIDRWDSGNDVLIVGDFNDDLDQSISVPHQSPYENFTDDSKYQCITKSLNIRGWHSTVTYDDMIDHQVVFGAIADDYVINSASVVVPFGLIANYGNTTSDHLPVMSSFRVGENITGVFDKQADVREKLIVFPNPTSGPISMNIDGDRRALFSIWGMDGRLVSSCDGIANECLKILSENLADSTNGIYSLTVDDLVDLIHRSVRVIKKGPG